MEGPIASTSRGGPGRLLVGGEAPEEHARDDVVVAAARLVHTRTSPVRTRPWLVTVGAQANVL
jgi:hypothetical protein